MKMPFYTGAAAMLLATSQILQAVPITGSIGFTGGMTFDTSTPATASQETSWINPQVTLDAGVFAVPSLFAISLGTPVIFSPAIWNFNTTTPILNFWSVGGFTFELISSYVDSQGGTPGVDGYVDVNGTGIVSGNGYTPTVMSFNLTTQDPVAGHNPDSWTFSASGASTSVGDGGSTLILFGLALSGLAWFARKTGARI